MNVQNKTAELIAVGRQELLLDEQRLEHNRTRVLARALALGVAGAGVAVSSSTAAAAGAGSAGSAGVSLATKSLAAWSLGKLTAVAAVVAVSATGSYALIEESRQAPVVPPPSAALQQRPAAPRSAPPVTALPQSAPASAPQADEVSAEPSPPNAGVTGNAPSKTPTSRSGLSEHLELLREARTALAAGNAAKALSVLDAHPEAARGPLGPEWTAARVLVLCRLGRAAEARQLGQRFLKAHPSSPLAAQVRASCATAN